MIRIGIGQSFQSGLLHDIVVSSVSIIGLSGNPTHGLTAQDGVPLTAVASGFPDGTTFSYLWRTQQSASSLGTSATFTPDASAIDLDTLYCVVTPSVGDPFSSSSYVVRYGVLPTVALTASSDTIPTGTPAGFTLATIILGNTGETPRLSGPDASLFAISGSNLILLEDADTSGEYSVTINIGNSFSATEATADFNLIVEQVDAIITGLTNNPTYGATAQIGTHASIGAAMSDSSTITTYKWGSTAGGSEYGTGSAPADFTAGDGGTLYLTATTADGDFTASATIRHASPVAGSLLPVNETQGIGTQTVNVAAGFNGSGLVYTESVAWASISGSTLTINDEVRTDTVTITATNSGGAATVDLSVTIEEGADVSAPVLSDVTWNDGTDTASFTVSEGGTLIVATHDSADTLTADGSGGWTGTTIETDSVAIAGAGPTDYVLTYTSASNAANRLSYYVRDADGNDSDVETETFTSNLIVTNMLTNGDGNAETTGWSTRNGMLSNDAGALRLSSTGSPCWVAQSVATVIGETYNLKGIWTSSGASTWRLIAGPAAGSTVDYAGTTDTTGDIDVNFTASSTTTHISLRSVTGLNPGTSYVDFDNIILTEVP